MNVANLVTMANQIGAFYETFPDREQASVEAAQHLKRYWAPIMRNELYAYIDHEGGSDLSPFVRASIAAHRAEQAAPPPPGGDAG
ncbi:formate dehydrogenase subunit delta [Oxalobacteraceae bacterium A2-2]